MNNNNIRFIDIFCGCGGLALGFQDAGFEFLMGVDNDNPSLDTLKYNFPDTIAVNLDLFKKETPIDIKARLGRKQVDIFETESDNSIDIIIGGPPCQGMSLTGPRKFDDPRNRLYQAFIDLVGALQPSAFVIENVPGMKNLYGGRIFKEIKSRFKKLGFTVQYDILNSADYGVPQIRKRLFIIGLKQELGLYEFPEPSVRPEKYISCEDAISDLPARRPENGIGKDTDIYSIKPFILSTCPAIICPPLFIPTLGS